MKICVFQLGFGGEGGMREEVDSVYFTTMTSPQKNPPKKLLSTQLKQIGACRIFQGVR